MSSLAKNLKALAAVAAIAASGWATSAAALTCGVTGQSSGTTRLVYDPFNSSSASTATVTMALDRVNFSGGGDTRYVNLILKASSANLSAANGTEIVPISSSLGGQTAGYGLNIFYGTNETPPNLLPPSALPTGGTRFFHMDFTGNNAGSNTATVTFNIKLPASMDLQAVQNLAFDAYFSCEIRGGGSDNGKEQTGSFANAVVFPVTVLSALRASYVGTALDFGEITQKIPGHRTNIGNVRVQSSGAYQVELTSANSYKLERPGAVTDNDRVGYKIDFLGTVRSPSNTTAIDQTCVRAGLESAGNGELLPIRAELVEAGAGKSPSPTYSDLLTVTVTPLAYNTVATTDCGGFTLPSP